MPQVTKHSPEAYNWLGVITGVKITKKPKPFLKRSTSFPKAGGCACFADASSSPAFAYIFGGNHWLYPAAFFGRRLGTEFFCVVRNLQARKSLPVWEGIGQTSWSFRYIHNHKAWEDTAWFGGTVPPHLVGSVCFSSSWSADSAAMIAAQALIQT